MCSDMNNTANHLLTSSCISLFSIYIYISLYRYRKFSDQLRLVICVVCDGLQDSENWHKKRTPLPVITATVSVFCDEWTRHKDFNFKVLVQLSYDFSFKYLTQAGFITMQLHVNIKISLSNKIINRTQDSRNLV